VELCNARLSCACRAYSLSVGLKEFRAAEGVAASWRSIHASKDPTTFTVIFEDSAALLGLATAFFGTLLDQTFGWRRADGIASIAIGSILTVVAILLVIESKALLVGEGADLDTLRAIRRLTQTQPGVEFAGYPLTMYFGPGNILLTMNVRFAETLSRDQIEAAIDGIEAKVRIRFPSIRHIYLEAESFAANSRFADPEYPNAGDLPPCHVECLR
jgi:divalent metal cation (Fe/Co/Zn/Cd) transporter